MSGGALSGLILGVSLVLGDGRVWVGEEEGCAGMVGFPDA